VGIERLEMIAVTEIISDIDHATLQMVAEVLACCDPDPAKRREHRISKLASFAEDHQAQVRDITNRVIEARNAA
jgi:hypothetical protein